MIQFFLFIFLIIVGLLSGLFMIVFLRDGESDRWVIGAGALSFLCFYLAADLIMPAIMAIRAL